VRAAERAAAAAGLEIIGFFHSHPDHPARPSAFDREHAWPWYAYLIVSVEDGRAVDWRVWELQEDRSAFVERPLEVTG
jgi:proteasome lid subunit RPN8/RPN11